MVRDITLFCFSLSQTAEAKLRTPRPMRSCMLGSGDDMTSSTARWSLKSVVVSAIMNCTLHDDDTPSTANDDKKHFEK